MSGCGVAPSLTWKLPVLNERMSFGSRGPRFGLRPVCWASIWYIGRPTWRGAGAGVGSMTAVGSAVGATVGAMVAVGSSRSSSAGPAAAGVAEALVGLVLNSALHAAT